MNEQAQQIHEIIKSLADKFDMNKALPEQEEVEEMFKGTNDQLESLSIRGEKYDLNLIDDIEIDGIDMRDYPDFCDAFLIGASYKGRELNEDELEYIQDSNPEWFYDKVWDYIF